MKRFIKGHAENRDYQEFQFQSEADLLYEKVFTLIAGVNGVGKTTFVKTIQNRHSDLGFIINPDTLARKFGGNLAGGKEALKQIEYCIANGIKFAEETTLSGNHIVKVIQRCKDNGYTINMIYIGLNSPEESLSRIANRVKHGGHNIPENIVRRRYKEICRSLTKVLPLCDYAEFYDNENGPEKIAVYSNDEIRQLVEAYPEWMQEFVDTATE